MSAYPSWALLCGILGCLGAVVLLAWHTAQEQRAGRFDSLVAVVARSQSLVLFRAVAIARWTCIGVLAIAVVGLSAELVRNTRLSSAQWYPELRKSRVGLMARLILELLEPRLGRRNTGVRARRSARCPSRP